MGKKCYRNEVWHIGNIKYQNEVAATRHTWHYRHGGYTLHSFSPLFVTCSSFPNFLLFFRLLTAACLPSCPSYLPSFLHLFIPSLRVSVLFISRLSFASFPSSATLPCALLLPHTDFLASFFHSLFHFLVCSSSFSFLTASYRRYFFSLLYSIFSSHPSSFSLFIHFFRPSSYSSPFNSYHYIFFLCNEGDIPRAKQKEKTKARRLLLLVKKK